MAAPAWPEKSRELHNHHLDSTMWNDLVSRDDDIVIATYAKSATTWMQQIVAQLLFGGDPELTVAEMSPWLDLRVPSSRPARDGPVEVIQPWVGSLPCTPQAFGRRGERLISDP